MRIIIHLFYNLYKKKCKSNPGKTKLSRYLYGCEIYRNLDDHEKRKIRQTCKKYYPNIKIQSRKYRKISRDLAFSKRYYKCDNSEYFMFDFYHKNDKIRKTFITGIRKREYIHMLNSDDTIALLKDKYETYKILKDLYQRDVIEIRTKNDYKKYDEFVTKHPKFIKKSNNLSCGKSIEIIKVTEENKKEIFNNFLEESKSTVLEELVQQADDMAILHPESVNTVRIITFLDDNNMIKIKYSFLRVGVGSSIVDNGGAGGIICSIDDQTGVCRTDGVDELFNFYKMHPDTYTVFKGFKLPEWEEACNLAKEAQRRVKGARLIGWDLAYTDNGWVLIEGNGHTQFIGQQIADQIGKKEPFEKMINYEKLKKEYYKDKSKFIFSVVIPVYNTEKYLEETINSIINQTINFKNIELILVNDGSTDKSEEICKKYQNKYPDNIKYIYQKNSGVSAARNEGMKHVTGKYVNFLDSDDKWKSDAFEKVKNFFEERTTKIDIVTCRQKFFEGKTGYPNQDYKFKEAKNYVVDINKNPDYMVLSVSSSFIKTEALKDHKFDTKLNYGEDSKFLTEILLEKEKYGLAKDAIFHLRKRENNSSLTQNASIDIRRYTNTMEYYYKYLIKLSKAKYDTVIPYIQHVIINGLKFRISNTIPENIDKEVKMKYIKNIIELLSYIDDEVIVETRNVNYNIKYYILNLKHQKQVKCKVDSNMNILYDNIIIGKLNGNKKLMISSINIIDNAITIEGLFKFPMYVDIKKVWIECHNKKYTLSFIDTLELDKLSFKNEVIAKVESFKLNIEDISAVNELRAFMETEYGIIDLTIEFFNDELFMNTKKDFIKINDYMLLKSSKNTLIIKKCGLLNELKHKLLKK